MREMVTMKPKLEDLSFVERKCDRLCTWIPVKDKGYSELNRIGRERADEFAAHVGKTGNTALLSHIVTEIHTSGAIGGCEVGFLQRIAERAIS